MSRPKTTGCFASRKELESWIAKRRAAGDSMEEIMGCAGIGYATVQKILRDRNIETKPLNRGFQNAARNTNLDKG